MEAKDGSFGFDFEAVYDQVVELEKNRLYHDQWRKATTTFDAEGQNPIEMQRDDRQTIVDNFKKYVEN